MDEVKQRGRDGMTPWIAQRSLEAGAWEPTSREEEPGFHLFPTETELQRGYLRFAMLFDELFP
eukprot:11228245-Lingulodinium_polyedra.AAC.1